MVLTWFSLLSPPEFFLRGRSADTATLIQGFSGCPGRCTRFGSPGAAFCQAPLDWLPRLSFLTQFLMGEKWPCLRQHVGLPKGSTSDAVCRSLLVGRTAALAITPPPRSLAIPRWDWGLCASVFPIFPRRQIGFALWRTFFRCLALLSGGTEFRF